MPPSSFETLPTEIEFAIYRYLSFGAQKQLSLVNKSCRKAVGTILFRSIRVITDSWPDPSFIDQYQSTITHLTLAAAADLEGDQRPLGESYQPTRDDNGSQGKDHTTGNETGGEQRNTTPPLAQAAGDLLTGSRLPQVRSVHLSFDLFDFSWHVSHPNNGFYIFEGVETKEDTLLCEEFLGWRALMRDIWAALSRNENIEELTITKFVPKPVSTFDTAEFKNFMGRLKKLDFASIYADDNSAGWKSQTNYGYCHFLCQLGTLFYQHAQRLESLRIVATTEGNIGGGVFEEFSRHAPHSMLPDHMTQLQHFEMVACYIDGTLADFLAHRSKTLKTVKMRNCSSTCFDSDPYTWAQFFKAIASRNPEALTRFEVEKDLKAHGEEDNDSAPVFALERIQEITEALGAETEQNMVFMYSDNDIKYGDTWLNEEATSESFERGEDARQYNNLMEIIRRNAG